MHIAVDAMGTERGIGIAVEGAMKAIRENSQVEVTLVGNRKKIEEEIRKLRLESSPFSIIHASEIVEMKDSPAISLNRKNSSIAVALDLLREGKTDALISAGNTGAVMALALLKLGRLKGVRRPCLAAVFPTTNGGKVVLLDIGANVDCKPYHLFQFAVMGSVYAYKILRKRNPRVGLLNIGTEENKGNKLLLQTFKLLRDSSLNFVGNIEGGDLTRGKVDVVVCDGFVGNVILKFAESFARTTLNIVDKRMRRVLFGLGETISRRWRDDLKKDLDYAEYGGVPLLGVNGACVIAHGASSSKAMKNAILAGFEFAKVGINRHIESSLTKNGEIRDGVKRDSDNGNRVLCSKQGPDQF